MAMVRSVFERTHSILVPGDMPLTREMADSYAWYLATVYREASGGQTVLDRNALVRDLVASFRSMPTNQRVQLVGLVMNYTATTDYYLARASARAHQLMAVGWQKVIASQPPGPAVLFHREMAVIPMTAMIAASQSPTHRGGHPASSAADDAAFSSDMMNKHHENTMEIIRNMGPPTAHECTLHPWKAGC